MIRTQLKRLAFSGILLLLLVGVCGLWLHAQQRQYALHRQLIAALIKNDDKQALMLINEGADPNTQYEPTPLPSLPELVKRFLHRSPPPGNDSPTAFLIACGEPVSTDLRGSERSHDLDDAPMVQAMLKHGAKVNAKNWCGETALMCAVIANHRNTVGTLLQYGANINARDVYARTPLIVAVSRADVSPNVVRLLLNNKADANANEGIGLTPLMLTIMYNASPDVVRQLLQHGADANAKDMIGRTPLMWAQRLNHPDIIPLLKQAGARK